MPNSFISTSPEYEIVNQLPQYRDLERISCSKVNRKICIDRNYSYWTDALGSRSRNHRPAAQTTLRLYEWYGFSNLHACEVSRASPSIFLTQNNISLKSNLGNHGNHPAFLSITPSLRLKWPPRSDPAHRHAGRIIGSRTLILTLNRSRTAGQSSY